MMTAKFHLSLTKLSMLAFLVIFYGSRCNTLKFSNQQTDCDIINDIINHPYVEKALLLNETPEFRGSIIRVFTMNKKVECIGNFKNWNYKTYEELRPSLNIVYHRDIILIYYHKKIEAFIASQRNDNNRQTLNILKFNISGNHAEFVSVSQAID